MFLVDSHCDSIQQCDIRRHGIVNPYNFSARCQQLQFVAMFCSWPGDTVEKCFQRAVRYIGNFYIAMNSESEKIVQVRTYADIERGTVNMRIETLLRICTVLRITPDAVVTEEKDFSYDADLLFKQLNTCTPQEKETALRLLSVYMESLHQ